MGVLPHGDGCAWRRLPSLPSDTAVHHLCAFAFVCTPGAPTSDPLKDLRKQPIHGERLSPLDLDEMARVIAGAVHSTGTDGAWAGPGRGPGGKPREPAGSSEEPLSKDGDRGRDGLRGEPPISIVMGGGDEAAEWWGPRRAKLGRIRAGTPGRWAS